MKRLKSPKAKLPAEQLNKEGKFEGQGVMFKCKLFGMLKVPGARGDDICQDAMITLKQQSLKSRKESGSHKQRIFLNLSVKGIRIIDEKSQEMQHGHPIHRISYISHDKEDKRTFGYIVSLQEGYTLFAFRTEKAATLLTANLKELFQVVYQKYKTKRETTENGGPPPKCEPETEEVEQGEEVRGSDPYYAVPDKVTLVDSPRSQDSARQQTSESSVGNLLDWSDVNEQIEEINQGMKRSDTAELLDGVDDLNFSSAIGDDVVTPDAFGENRGFSDPFGEDPFFRPDGLESANEERSLRSSASDSDIKQRSNPFLTTPGSDPFSPSEAGSIAKCKSLEIFSVEKRNEARAPANTPDLFSNDPFRSSTGENQSKLSNVDDLFGFHTPNVGFIAQPTVTHEAPLQPLQSPVANEVCLEPTRPGQGNENDPFALLSGEIQGMKGAMPTGKMADGTNVPGFPQQKAKPRTQGPPLRVASGPTIPPQGFSSNNPFAQQGQQSYRGMQSQGYPQIPPRMDLRAQAPQVNMQVGRPSSPFGVQPNPMMPSGGQQNWGNFGGSQPGMPQMGGGFVGNVQQPGMENLYATVDKPRKSASDDLFDLRGGNMDLFGAVGATTQQPMAQSSNKDPFGDLSGFGFN